jgi:predicted N-acetyltransferase YhbS
MILFGNSDYSHRFGFNNGEKYRVTTKDNQNLESFMALEIHENNLTKMNRHFLEDESYSIDDVN